MSTLMVHRCTRCGRWSHAQRKPRFHIRSVIDVDEGDHIVQAWDPIYDLNFGEVREVDAGGYLIRCGPFESFWAVSVS
jgi:hypothetical protein